MNRNKKYKSNFYLLFYFFSVLLVPIHGATHYVYKNASGSNDGSNWVNAWISFADINWSIIVPGDTIKISGGTDSLSYNETLYVNVSGTSDRPVTISSAVEEGYNGRVIIDGDSIRGTGIYILAKKYINIAGIKVTNHIGNDIYVSGASGSVYSESDASSYITLDSLEVNITGRAVFIQTSDHIIVKNCNIYTPTLVAHQTDGIYSQRNQNNFYDHNNIVINNTDPNGHDDGIQMYEDMSITVCNNYIEQNNGKVGNAQGIYSTNGHGDNIWYNNVVALVNGTTSNGISYRLNLDGTISMIGNTVYCERAFNTMYVEDVPDPIIKNNILWNDYLAAPLTLINWNGNPANIDNNLLYGPNTSEGIVKISDVEWLSWSDYQQRGFDAHGVNANPEFVNVTGKDFRLKPNSPAINAGVTLDAPFNVDKEGTIRPFGTAYDIGAYEYTGITGIKVGERIFPDFKLEQNYPNPFNPTTVINYYLPRSSYVSLKVYNLIGQEVATLVNKQQAKGSYRIDFDASTFASGVYFYKLKAGNYNQSKKMLLLR